MLFRETHDASHGVGVVGSNVDGLCSEEDERDSTGGRSYASTESSATQNFEHRMMQLKTSNRLMPDIRSSSQLLNQTDTAGETSCHQFTDRAQALPIFSAADGTFSAGSDLAGYPDSPLPSRKTHSGRNLRGQGDARGSSPSAADNAAGQRENSDDSDAEYLEELLRNIEKLAARLDTQFYRYPPPETIKQVMAVTPSGGEAKERVTPISTVPFQKVTEREESTIDLSKDGLNEAPTSSLQVPHSDPQASMPLPATSPPSSSAGTKLFMGGLRFEVIQSGRHMISWIFQVACGVQLIPSSILIHRKTKNGRSNVAPTGCASVFVSTDAEVQQLLDMNQRIYCAEEGVYVAPSPAVMKELIASKDVVDVTAGRVRGPTHPVVIERAYSVSHHHGAREGGGNGSRAPNTGGTAAVVAGANQHGRTPSSASVESGISGPLLGAMPPPYSGVVLPPYDPNLALPPPAPGQPGVLQPPSYESSTASSTIGASGTSKRSSLLQAGTSPTFHKSSSVKQDPLTPSTYSTFADVLPCCATAATPLIMSDPQRVTFHAYLRGDAAARMQSLATASLPADLGPAKGTEPHQTVLFVAALPTDMAADYVSWLFSIMTITLPPSRIHIMGGGVSDSSDGLRPSAARSASDGCATVSLDDADVSIALNHHNRVLCTSRGAWVGYSGQDVACLRASDASLRDFPVLHIDRRMQGPKGNDGCASAQVSLPYSINGALPRAASASRLSPHPPPPWPMRPGYATTMYNGMPLLPPNPMSGCPSATALFSAPWPYYPPLSSPNGIRSAPVGTAATLMGGVPSTTGAGKETPQPFALLPPTNMQGPVRGTSNLPLPFPYPQTVTIGDRVYQLPPGATLQLLPVITALGGVGGEVTENGDGAGGGSAATHDDRR